MRGLSGYAYPDKMEGVRERDGNPYALSKRVFDVCMAALGMLLLFPLFLLIAAVVGLSSPGPVLFRQKRVGLNGKVFTMYKFRTMVVDSEARLAALVGQNMMNGNIFKIKDDPRITKYGKILRKTSMDELPQLLNVLKGEMSLVGPRPPLVREYIQYEGWHSMRLSVKPGMTGLWQICGRSSVNFDEMLRLDLRYIREKSLWNDLKIILCTLPLLLGDKNAF